MYLCSIYDNFIFFSFSMALNLQFVVCCFVWNNYGDLFSNKISDSGWVGILLNFILGNFYLKYVPIEKILFFFFLNYHLFLGAWPTLDHFGFHLGLPPSVSPVFQCVHTHMHTHLLTSSVNSILKHMWVFTFLEETFFPFTDLLGVKMGTVRYILVFSLWVIPFGGSSVLLFIQLSPCYELNCVPPN